jgi:hypothetical protein
MENPWTELPRTAPFVLPSDRPFVDAFNREHKWDDKYDKYRLRTEVRPIPALGNRGAPVVLLSRNPGFDDDDLLTEEHPKCRSLLEANLTEEGDLVHPGLTREFADTAGGAWWRRCMKGVTQALGCDPNELAGSVLAVEFHAYPSKSWAPLPVTLPSQWYGFELVRRAIERGAMVVVLRGARDWRVAVPGLADHQHRTIVPTNYRQSSVSERTCGAQFDDLLRCFGP